MRVQETDAMMATLAGPTNGQGTLGNDSEGLRAALSAAQAPELESEISPTGRGASIYHAIANHGGMPVRDLAAWICVEKKCSRVSRGRRCGAVMGFHSNCGLVVVSVVLEHRCTRWFLKLCLTQGWL